MGDDWSTEEVNERKHLQKFITAGVREGKEAMSQITLDLAYKVNYTTASSYRDGRTRVREAKTMIYLLFTCFETLEYIHSYALICYNIHIYKLLYHPQNVIQSILCISNLIYKTI